MKKQIEALAMQARENMKKNALNKANTILAQIDKTVGTLKAAAEAAAEAASSAKRGKIRAAKSAAAEAAEMYTFAADVLTGLKTEMQAASEAAAREAAAEKEAREAAAAAKREAASAGKTANKTVLSQTARALNNYRNSYKGILRDVANDLHVNGVNSPYLKQIVTAVYGGLKTEKNKGEETNAFVARALKNGVAYTANLDITKTLIYQYLCSPQKMFKVFCDTLPCVEISRENGKAKCTFARVKTVAYNAEKAGVAIKENEDKFTRTIINETLYYIDNEYMDIDFQAELSEAGTKVLSRRRLCSEKIEQNRFFVQGGNIVTLQASDKVNFAQLLPALASVCTAGALQKHDKAAREAAEAAAAEAAEKAAAEAKAAARREAAIKAAATRKAKRAAAEAAAA
ncbi:MAG: hypothetical protein ACI36Z_01290 [Alloprevotella sp.]